MIEREIAEFGRRMGMPAFSLSPAGLAALDVERLGRLHLELAESAGERELLVYLARAVDPAISDAITKKYPEVGAERQDIRQYPGGSLAANVVGDIGWDGHGLLGLEDSFDAKLSGTDGSVTDARVLRATPARTFDREALNAVKRWKFEPISSPTTTRRTLAFQPNN